MSKDKAPGIEESTKSIGGLIDKRLCRWILIESRSPLSLAFYISCQDDEKQQVYGGGERSWRSLSIREAVSTHRLGFLGCLSTAATSRRGRRKVFYVHYALRFYVVLTAAHTRTYAGNFGRNFVPASSRRRRGKRRRASFPRALREPLRTVRSTTHTRERDREIDM